MISIDIPYNIILLRVLNTIYIHLQLIRCPPLR